jgi:hypothetical protein
VPLAMTPSSVIARYDSAEAISVERHEITTPRQVEARNDAPPFVIALQGALFIICHCEAC